MNLNRWHRFLLGLLVLGIFFITACSNIQIRIGRPLKTDPLESSLKLGESTTADIILALGQPFGKGRVMFPSDARPRSMLTYYYGEGDMQDARGMYLFVFLNQDKFDGYMWFSSLAPQKPNQAPNQGG